MAGSLGVLGGLGLEAAGPIQGVLFGVKGAVIPNAVHHQLHIPFSGFGLFRLRDLHAGASLQNICSITRLRKSRPPGAAF